MSGQNMSGMDELCEGLCASFIDALPAAGAALSVFSGSASETTLRASDEVAAKLDELQFDLGEGPRWEAARTRTPVLLSDTRSMTHEKWPVFAKALSDTEVRALFVFPMVVGAIDIGVVELYTTTPGRLDDSDLINAHALVDGAAWALLRCILIPESTGGSIRESGVSSPGESQMTSLSPSRREIHQATGIVLAQTGGTATDALLLLRGHAFAHDQTVHQASEEVLARRLSFTPMNLA